MRRGDSMIQGYAIRRPTALDSNMLQTESGERMCGVGMVLQKHNTDGDYGYVSVKRLVKDSPAERAGLMEDDLVMTIDGVDLRCVPEDKLPGLVVGAHGSEIIMVYNRGGAALRMVKVKRTLETARAQFTDKLTSVVLVLSKGPSALTVEKIQRYGVYVSVSLCVCVRCV
jgi:C-terminal processing protease CtpA/Prc